MLCVDMHKLLLHMVRVREMSAKYGTSSSSSSAFGSSSDGIAPPRNFAASHAAFKASSNANTFVSSVIKVSHLHSASEPVKVSNKAAKAAAGPWDMQREINKRLFGFEHSKACTQEKSKNHSSKNSKSSVRSFHAL